MFHPSTGKNARENEPVKMSTKFARPTKLGPVRNV